MTAQAPALSVVLCSAGAGTFLDHQLRALHLQTTDLVWELVFVDNGCTPEALELVRRWLDRFALARLVTAQEARGPAYGRNAGAHKAAADLVAFCDDDDVVSPTWVHEMHRALQDKDLVGGCMDVELLNSAAVQKWRPRPQGGGLYAFPGSLPFVMSSNMGVRRELFLRVGAFDPALYPGEDVAVSWKVQLAGGRVGFAPDVVLHYRYRSTRRSHLRQQWTYGRSSGLLKLAYPELSPGSQFKTMAAALLELLGNSWVMLRSSADRTRHLGGFSFWLAEAVTLLRRHAP